MKSWQKRSRPLQPNSALAIEAKRDMFYSSLIKWVCVVATEDRTRPRPVTFFPFLSLLHSALQSFLYWNCWSYFWFVFLGTVSLEVWRVEQLFRCGKVRDECWDCPCACLLCTSQCNFRGGVVEFISLQMPRLLTLSTFPLCLCLCLCLCLSLFHSSPPLPAFFLSFFLSFIVICHSGSVQMIQKAYA